MKNSKHSFIGTIGYKLFILGFIFLFTACKKEASQDEANDTEIEEVVKANEINWKVEAILPDGKSLKVKAFDNSGKSYDIMAIQDSDQDDFLSVKAVVGDKKLPVKMLLNSEQFAPVAVITNQGNTYSLKAITAEGDKLDVKGIRRYGNIVIVKAIAKNGDYLGVKAVSPTGQVNDVKGIKIARGDREMSIKGKGVYAHVKALHQAAYEDKFKMPKKREDNKRVTYKSDFERVIWKVKAVTPDGKTLDVKAFDPEGNSFDVVGTQDCEQHSFMNIKTIVKGYELPVKVMSSVEDHKPIDAIATNGTIYEIKAVTDDGKKLDVKGVSRSGNIINARAINENGDFYEVKAFGPKGEIDYVKGVKIFDREVEMKVQGRPVYAHLKALNQ